MTGTDLNRLDQLGAEVVKFSSFEWLPGMLYVKVPEHNGATGYVNRVCDDVQAALLNKRKDVFPIINDPATIGVIENRLLAEEGIFIFPLFLGESEMEWPACYELLVPDRFEALETQLLHDTKFEAITEGLRIINDYKLQQKN
jgi:hypothetical protein